jgi:hypothetical protein
MQLERIYEARSEARERLQGIPELRRLPDGAISMGVAFTNNPHEYALAVRIREKRDVVQIETLLHALLTPIVEADALDIRYTGPAFAIQPMFASHSTPINPIISIGDSISHEQALGGTLGFFATDRADGRPGIVSANHVIAEADAANVGDFIVRPATGGASPTNIAELVRWIPLCGGGLKLADAAFARLMPNTFDSKTIPNGTLLQVIGDPRESPMVSKVGEKTGFTYGRITSFDYDKLNVLGYSSSLSVVSFENQIEIESADPMVRFARPGDSGALVYNNLFHAVGLLFARCVAGGFYKNGLAYASPLGPVCDLLQVDLLA